MALLSDGENGKICQVFLTAITPLHPHTRRTAEEEGQGERGLCKKGTERLKVAGSEGEGRGHESRNVEASRSRIVREFFP